MSTAQFEFRSTTDWAVEGSTIYGYAAVFDQATTIGSDFKEVIRKGAFAKSIAERDVLALLEHNPDRLLGRTSSKTLRLKEDSHGLAFELDLATDTVDGATALSLVRRRDFFGCSFSFNVISDEWDNSRSPRLRTLKHLKLWEISIVADPAYPTTTVNLRSPTVKPKRKKTLPVSVRTGAAALLARKVAMEHKIRGL